MRSLAFVLLSFVSSLVMAGTIQAPTEYVDGTPLALSELEHYTIECNGSPVEIPVTQATQTFILYGSCRATVTTVTGDTSDWSNTVFFANPTPRAPVLFSE